MTVGQDRSRDPRPGGDRPSPPLPGGAPVPAGLSLRPSCLPPPPSALPPNFFPAFLGFAAPSSARRVGSGFAAVGASSPLSSPGLVSPAPRRLRSAVVGPLFLDTSSGPICDEVNAALSAWRHDGCPATGPLMAPIPGPVSILRAPSAFKARRSLRVRFNIPEPGHLSEAPASPLRLQATSHRLSSPSAAAGGSMDAAPAGEQWTRVLSRRARQEARRTERRDADSLRCPPSNPHPLRRSSPPLHRPPAPRYRPNRRCFRCQAKDHLVASCRDPVRGESARRSGTRAPSGGVTGGRRADQERHRSRYNSRGYDGRQHGASATTLASIVLRTSPVPPLTVAATGVAVDEPLSDAEVTVQLQSLLRTGIANLRTSLPAILGCSSPTPAAPAHSPFQSACRSWTEAIRAAPASLVMGSSRLASPPPCSFASTDASSAWEEDEEDAAVALRCSPQRRAPVLLMASPPVQVPNSWDDADGDEAWFDADADGDAAALADAVALAPLLSPSQAAATTDVTAGVQHARVITSVEDLFDRPPVAILPAPIALMLAAPLPPPEERRSVRLAAKPIIYSKRVWQHAATWLSCPSLLLDLGSGRESVLQYWHAITRSPTACPEGLKSAVTLITWELWKERNARVFSNKASMPSAVMQKIKDESKNWILAGAKHLADITA
ncbi:hypothetical protein ACQ4PT_034795 [Festuca glaucescens]